MRKSHRKHNYLADMPGSRWKDIGGQRFGRLVAWEPTGEKRHGQQVWLCKCDCGNVKSVAIGQLSEKPGGTKSCGCLVKEAPSSIKHGMTGKPVHNCWMNMLKRCRSETNPSYKYYGARGIKVCDRWLDFQNFYADMGEPPFPGAEIDRENPHGNYCPENCRWLSGYENKSRAHKGRTKPRQKALPPCSRDTTLP